jgi:hypothetical protein
VQSRQASGALLATIECLRLGTHLLRHGQEIALQGRAKTFLPGFLLDIWRRTLTAASELPGALPPEFLRFLPATCKSVGHVLCQREPTTSRGLSHALTVAVCCVH